MRRSQRMITLGSSVRENNNDIILSPKSQSIINLSGGQEYTNLTRNAKSLIELLYQMSFI